MLSLESKIVSNNDVKTDKRNYIASFQIRKGHFCTGFLASEKHIITAAQCLVDFLKYKDIPEFIDYTVMVGSNIINHNNSYANIDQVEVLSDFKVNILNSTPDIGVITVYD